MKDITKNILAFFGGEKVKSPDLSGKTRIIHDGFGVTIELIYID